MMLDKKFNLDNFSDWIEEFLPDFSRDLRKVEVPNGFSDVNSIKTLGESSLGVRVFIIETSKDPSGRKVGLTKDSFNLIKNYGTPNALIVYYSENSNNWRFSLLTSTPVWNDGKIITKLSNPKRHSYVLGPNAKVNTPTKFLIKNGKALDFIDLKSRFSLEVVNKEFYKEISESFTKLVGGTRGEGTNKKTYESLLKLPSTNDHSQTSIEFAVRLIGRVIFCWFLREKIGESGISLMPKNLLSLKAISDSPDYYHNVLEPIFFEVLNQTIKSRTDPYFSKPYSHIPYLNGGLFSPHDDDFYKRRANEMQSQFHNTLMIPDSWFKEFFSILETYNFTIDENTSIDEDLSIDPEMLGRIFENLLAEINPETGESARKSTGSYYTPRLIVDYMVDESLILYLKQKTDINEEKLRVLISYDLSDDSLYPLSYDEIHKLVDAIEEVKILDPACGSGAYPIGALQKIVFILQQLDPDGQIWFRKQIKYVSAEFRQVLEREFTHKNFDWLRKLGIIRENIYGIDIQPIATEITRLRCFLTLVVDERIDETLVNRGIEPLPNLDFKFVTANSLIGLPKIPAQGELFDDSKKIEELRELRDRYFTARDDDRKDIMLAFSDLQSEMINELIDKHSWAGVAKAELTRKLTNWKPFKHRSTEWFDPEWMFGVKEGFDIVIANPPYITIGGKQISGIDSVIKSYFEKFYETYEYKTNSFSLFIEKSIHHLSKDGGLTYIIPRTLLDNYHMQKLRKFILNNCNISALLELKYRIFDNAETGGNILLITKGIRNNTTNIHRIKTQIIKSPEELQEARYILVNQNEYLDSAQNRFILSNEESFKLMKKIESESVELKKLVSIKNGVNTGNAANILLASDKLGSEYRKILEGKDILRYRVNWGGLWINYDPKIKSTMKLSDLKTRQSKIDFSLRNVEIFNSEKIILRQTSDRIIATLDKDKFITRHSTHLIQVADHNVCIEYILAVINSKLINYYYQLLIPETGKVFPEVKIINVENLPFKLPSKSLNEIMRTLVSKILKITQSENYLEDTKKQQQVLDYENQINLLVYELYGITGEEIKIVEGENHE